MSARGQTDANKYAQGDPMVGWNLGALEGHPLDKAYARVRSRVEVFSYGAMIRAYWRALWALSTPRKSNTEIKEHRDANP